MTKNDFHEYMKTKHGSDSPLLRTLMSSVEIKLANQLVKDGVLMKGKQPKGGSLTAGYTMYYLPQPTWCYHV